MGRPGCRTRLRKADARGFTLIELLVVMLIITGTFVLVGLVVFRGSAQRDAAMLLQGALAGARDAAISSGQPRGIRLLPDTDIPLRRLPGGQIDPSAPLSASRIASIEPAPPYSEGRVSIGYVIGLPPGFPPPYPGSPTEVYPCPGKTIFVEECPEDPNTAIANSPTSWFWNVRIGDRIRFGDLGNWYTVVGPMTIPNAGLFVNCGRPGVDFPRRKSPLIRFYSGRIVEVEFLFLVNGRDDDGNGYVDDGFDGIDNNQDGRVDEVAEWEEETWLGSQASTVTFNQPYTIARRPVRSPNSKDLALPSGVVVDLTTWGTSRERSRLPVDPMSGAVDVLLYPNGQVVPTTVYSTPASAKMSSPFLHFWLADRGDLFDPIDANWPHLPLPKGMNPGIDGRELDGDATLVSVNARTGLVNTTVPSRFDAENIGKSCFDASVPFRDAERGVR